MKKLDNKRKDLDLYNINLEKFYRDSLISEAVALDVDNLMRLHKLEQTLFENKQLSKLMQELTLEFEPDLYFLLQSERGVRRAFVKSLLHYFGDDRELVYMEYVGRDFSEIERLLERLIPKHLDIGRVFWGTLYYDLIKTSNSAFTVVDLQGTLDNIAKSAGVESVDVSDIILVALNMDVTRPHLNPIWDLAHEVLHNVYNTKDEQTVQRGVIEFLIENDYTQTLALQFLLEFYARYIGEPSQTGTWFRLGYSVYDKFMSYFLRDNPALFISILDTISKTILGTTHLSSEVKEDLQDVIQEYLDNVDWDEPLEDTDGAVYL